MVNALRTRGRLIGFLHMEIVCISCFDAGSGLRMFHFFSFFALLHLRNGGMCMHDEQPHRQ